MDRSTEIATSVTARATASNPSRAPGPRKAVLMTSRPPRGRGAGGEAAEGAPDDLERHRHTGGGVHAVVAHHVVESEGDHVSTVFDLQ